jgi:hypothetical protein
MEAVSTPGYISSYRCAPPQPDPGPAPDNVERESAIIEGMARAFDEAAPADDCTGLAEALNFLGQQFLTQVRMADAADDRKPAAA